MSGQDVDFELQKVVRKLELLRDEEFQISMDIAEAETKYDNWDKRTDVQIKLMSNLESIRGEISQYKAKLDVLQAIKKKKEVENYKKNAENEYKYLY